MEYTKFISYIYVCMCVFVCMYVWMYVCMYIWSPQNKFLLKSTIPMFILYQRIPADSLVLYITRLLKARFWLFNTLRPRQNGRHFADDIFKYIFLNENLWIPIKISLKFVPKGRMNNIPALVQIMAWRLPGDKPLFEPMMVSLPTHVYASLGLNELNKQFLSSLIVFVEIYIVLNCIF